MANIHTHVYTYTDLYKGLQFSRSVMSDALQPHESKHTRPPCPSPTPRVHSNSCASSRWCHPAISSSVVPSPPAPNPSQHQGLFQWVSSSHQVAKVLEFQPQHQSLTMPKPLTVWITINCGKFWKRWEYQITLPTSWEICRQFKKEQLELDMEQQTGSKLGKEYIKAIYCHLAYLTYMQSTSCEVLG